MNELSKEEKIMSSIVLPKPLHESIKKVADNEYSSIQAVIRRAIRLFCDARGVTSAQQPTNTN
jgi:Arc/MetJ-type ribon-helix-helix transcriptional regulator